jgi:hypothetical protein
MQIFYFKIPQIDEELKAEHALYINIDSSAEVIIMDRLYSPFAAERLVSAADAVSIDGFNYKINSATGAGVILNNQRLLGALEGSLDRQCWSVMGRMMDKSLSGPLPYYRKSYASKTPVISSPVFYGTVEIASVIRPNRTSSFSDYIIAAAATDLVIVSNEEIEIISDHNFTSIEEVGSLFFPHIILTQLSDLTLTQAATVEATVVDINEQPYPTDIEIFFENINGQISHSRKMTSNMTTSIKVAAPMMEIGDIVRIKAGTKYFASISDVSLEVVS